MSTYTEPCRPQTLSLHILLIKQYGKNMKTCPTSKNNKSGCFVYLHRTLKATNIVSSHPTYQTVKTWKLVLHSTSQGDRTSGTIMAYIVFTFVLWASSALFAFFSAFSLAASWSTIETKVYVLNNACLRDVNYNLQNH